MPSHALLRMIALVAIVYAQVVNVYSALIILTVLLIQKVQPAISLNNVVVQAQPNAVQTHMDQLALADPADANLTLDVRGTPTGQFANMTSRVITVDATLSQSVHCCPVPILLEAYVEQNQVVSTIWMVEGLVDATELQMAALLPTGNVLQ
jgi:hypothetical protein